MGPTHYDARTGVGGCYGSIAMNGRLRKEKRVGELKELGFELLGELRPRISTATSARSATGSSWSSKHGSLASVVTAGVLARSRASSCL